MKYRLLIRIITISLLVLLITLIASLGIWMVKPKKHLKAFILNKTVPTKQRYDHRAVSWVLQHEKYVKSNDVFYKPDRDYFGFYPVDAEEKKFNFKSLALQDIELVSDTADLVYYADTYGVYYSDWYASNMKIDPKQKVYGGMNQNDYLLLKRMKERNKSIITEFVMLGNPTSALVRTKTEDLFGLKWHGWVGKYFENLDLTTGNRLPDWIVNLYKSQNEGKWPFKKSGVILIHQYGKVLVLEQDNHLVSGLPEVYTEKDKAQEYNLPQSIHYPYWFDIVSSKPLNDTLSHFKLHTTSKGDSLLRAHRLNNTFPAVIQHKGDYTFYYFAGDFADSDVKMWNSYFAGIQGIHSFILSKETANKRNFFWKFYNPLMKNILKEIYNSKD